MMFAGFTVCGASLASMQVGESGVIAEISNIDPDLAKKFHQMGLTRGALITLEQRFPEYVVRTCKAQVGLTKSMLKAIYVRVSVG